MVRGATAEDMAIFDVAAIAASLPETATTMLVDRYLTYREASWICQVCNSPGYVITENRSATTAKTKASLPQHLPANRSAMPLFSFRSVIPLESATLSECPAPLPARQERNFGSSQKQIVKLPLALPPEHQCFAYDPPERNPTNDLAASLAAVHFCGLPCPSLGRSHAPMSPQPKRCGPTAHRILRPGWPREHTA